MVDPVIGTNELFTLLVDKSEDMTGTTSVYFSNAGGVVLAWWLTLASNPEDAPWLASSYQGEIPAGETAEIELSLNTSALQPRKDPYRTSFLLNSSSPTPTPVPLTQSLGIALSAIVSAKPDSERSIVTLHNASSLSASETLVSDVTPVDSTGLRILDASGVAYSGILSHNASKSTVTCVFAYDASIDGQRSYCPLPLLKEGAFTLQVFDGDGAEVGSGLNHFTVVRCPSSYSLGGDTVCACDPGSYDTGRECALCGSGFISESRGATECTECAFPTLSNAPRTECNECLATYYHATEIGCLKCPETVDCDSGSQIEDWRLHPGYWRTSGTAVDVLPCRYATESCPGNTTGSSYCAEGYLGPLCSQCARKYFVPWAGDRCAKCDEQGNHGPSIGLGVVFLTLTALVAGLAFTKIKKVKARAQYQRIEEVRQAGETKAKICFFSAQVK